MIDSFQNEVPKARINLKLDLHTGGGASKKAERVLVQKLAGHESGELAILRNTLTCTSRPITTLASWPVPISTSRSCSPRKLTHPARTCIWL